MELIKDYNLELHYHPRKVNVVADALSRNPQCHCMMAQPWDDTLCKELEKLNNGTIAHGCNFNIELTPTLMELIVEAQRKDIGINLELCTLETEL